ncbi:MAG: hypothetical protein KJO75_16020 [Dactylosporangium sp.]|nr:hypothetical protein [Dactylosporangium sp.]
MLTEALDTLLGGGRGRIQDETQATYAGWMDEHFLDFSPHRSAAETHRQIRTFRFAAGGRHGPVAQVGADRLELLSSSLEPTDGLRLECSDGPLWISSFQPEYEYLPPNELRWVRR